MRALSRPQGSAIFLRMFRRRDPRSYSRMAREAIWPRGGWSRAITYVKHRLRRLPDPPDVVARGVAAGVFTTFTPLFGLHFVVAYALARLVKGNGWAAVAGTFFGNPLTFVPIAWTSLTMGHWLLGTGRTVSEHETRGVFGAFSRAGWDLWHNALAPFTHQRASWHGLADFFRDVFLPYLVGGILPGIACGVAAYYVTLPAIAAYAKAKAARQARLKAKRAGGGPAAAKPRGGAPRNA